MIGSFGNIIFVVSREKAHTFKDLSRSEGGRWSKHDIHLKKPKLEFLGPDTSKLSFKMELRANMGIDPRKETDKLIRMQRNGEYGLFILGGKRIGVGYFALTNVQLDHDVVDNKGNVLAATVNVTLEEYV